MQNGSLFRAVRMTGPDVWEYRWRESGHDGKRKHRRMVIGSIEQYPDESSAIKSVAALRQEINLQDVRTRNNLITMSELTNHYRQRELATDNVWKTYSTKKNYERYLDRWILPRWKAYVLSTIRAVEVELWLRSLPLARASCAKIRNIMSVLFNHGIRHEICDRNPIKFVRQGAKRRKIPEILDVEEIQKLLAALNRREYTLVLLAACTGLRMSELFGLKWKDIDFMLKQINVVRSVVMQVTGPCKTEASQKPIPLDPYLTEALQTWRRHTPYSQSEDWVFASPKAKGRKPYWGQSIMRGIIQPIARQLGITKRVGWHTFRHTYSTLLRANGADIKVMQELLRHASTRVTLDTYTQAVTPQKRAAQSTVVHLFRTCRDHCP